MEIASLAHSETFYFVIAIYYIKSTTGESSNNSCSWMTAVVNCLNAVFQLSAIFTCFSLIYSTCMSLSKYLFTCNMCGAEEQVVKMLTHIPNVIEIRVWKAKCFLSTHATHARGSKHTMVMTWILMGKRKTSQKFIWKKKNLKPRNKKTILISFLNYITTMQCEAAATHQSTIFISLNYLFTRR